jgi:arsenite methyltransferase
MADDLEVDAEALRSQVRHTYREVALHPDRSFHFHTGRAAAAQVGYDLEVVDALPARTVESFAGVAHPFALRDLEPGERVVDIGCGAGFDTFIASMATAPDGRVIGVDMTDEMLSKAAEVAGDVGDERVEFRYGLAEELPIEDGWADVVISNGVINLCADKRQVLDEIRRVLRPGGFLQFADIANGRPVPEEAVRNIDLWTA